MERESAQTNQEPRNQLPEEDIRAGPTLNSVFRQAAQQANRKSSEAAPIFVPGTIQSDKSLLDSIFSQAAQQANGK